MQKNRVYTFSKSERLCSRDRISDLYRKGETFKAYPLKVFVHAPTEENSTQNKIVISVPKRRFKRAVDRNKLKRRIKESYRYTRPTTIQTPTNKGLDLMLLYIGKEIVDLETINASMDRILKEIVRTHLTTSAI